MTPEESLARLWTGLARYFCANEYSEMDSFTFFEIAEEAGLVMKEAYDPDKLEHAWVDEADDGDMIYVYTDLGRQMAATLLLEGLMGDQT